MDPADKGGLCSLEHMDIDLLPAVSPPICLGEDCDTSILQLPPAVSMETNPFIPLNYSIGQLFFLLGSHFVIVNLVFNFDSY